MDAENRFQLIKMACRGHSR